MKSLNHLLNELEEILQTCQMYDDQLSEDERHACKGWFESGEGCIKQAINHFETANRYLGEYHD